MRKGFHFWSPLFLSSLVAELVDAAYSFASAVKLQLNVTSRDWRIINFIGVGEVEEGFFRLVHV